MRGFRKLGRMGNVFFFMWLVIRERCWDDWSLARRRLPHPSCWPLCDQEESILTTCCQHALHKNFVFSFCAELDDHLRKGFNSIIILGAWTLWNLRNRCVFYGEPPNLARALLLASEGLLFWGFCWGERHKLSPCPGAVCVLSVVAGRLQLLLRARLFV